MEHCLRPAGPEDHEFLFRLYSTTRPEVSAFGWPAQQQEAFLRMQFNAQKLWYQTAYPTTRHNIIVVGDVPVGRLLVSTGSDPITLIDIALLPEYRNQGIGTQVIIDLAKAAESQGQTVRLQVLRPNPAQHLYRRLGFLVTGGDEMYLQMQRGPGIRRDQN